MVNKKRGQVSIELGGRERVLKLTFNDYAELQEIYDDRPLMDILSGLDKLDIKLMRSLLCLALRHEDKDLTEIQVGAFELNITDIITKLGECIAASFGGGGTDEKKN